jgi:hypothetical protein
MADWDEERGRVSGPFDEWKLIDRDQRAFLRLGLDFVKVEYDRLWNGRWNAAAPAMVRASVCAIRRPRSDDGRRRRRGAAR